MPYTYLTRKGDSMPLGRKLVVEFIGTFFLVFTVCTAVSKSGADGLAPAHVPGYDRLRVRPLPVRAASRSPSGFSPAWT